MFRKNLSLFLVAILIFCSISSYFTYGALASEEAKMILTPNEIVTLSSSVTSEGLASGWTKTGGTATVSVQDGVSTVNFKGKKGGQLFTNTFTLEKNNTYRFSFEVKRGSDTKLSCTYGSVTNPEGIDFVIQDFGSLDKNSVASYRSYIEGTTDYAHAYKSINVKRVKTSLLWTLESDTDTPYIYSVTKYSPFGKYIGTSSSPIAALKTVDLEEFYSDWRTVTCEFSIPDEDEYTASDIALGFILPNDGDELYVRGVTMERVIPEIPDNTIPTTVVDTKGNVHTSGDDISVTTRATENPNGSYTLEISYDDMDSVNEFLGWYEGEKLLSKEQHFTTSSNVDFDSISAKILCKSVITGGLGFESYLANETSLRVDGGVSQALENTPPFDDKWGQIYQSYQQEDDWAFLIRATHGNFVTKYATAYNPSVDKKFETASTIVKPYSGESMMYFGTRARSVVRKLDNLKPNTEYELSFYVYNLSQWDFLHTATVADTYEMTVGNTTSNSDVKVYDYYKEIYKRLNDVYVEIADTSKIRNWRKITLNFTTDEDDNELYLHLYNITGRNADDTSKTFIDNLTVSEVVQPENFNECIRFLGNAIRKETDSVKSALRFKFEINDHIFKLNENRGYTLCEYGALAVYSDALKGDSLVLGDCLVDNGYKVLRGIAYNKEKGINQIFETTEKGYVVSFAFYNIGGFGNSTNYNFYNKNIAIRPYAIYKNSDGEELICYADTEKASLFDVADEIISKDTTDKNLSDFGISSKEYAKYLSDVLTVRSILDNSEAYAAYLKAGRGDYKINSQNSGSVLATDLGENISVHTELQAEFLSEPIIELFDKPYNEGVWGENLWEIANGTAELSRPLPITFSWSATYNGNSRFYGYLLTLSQNSDLSNAKYYSLYETSIDIYNLNIGTDYYWNVTAIYSDGMYVSPTDKFSVSDSAPRNLYIEGVTNVRDLGGWNIDGKTINQGVIYRMGGLNDITEEGKQTFKEELGIKTELDLRIGGEVVEVFYKDENINFYNVPMNSTYCLQYNPKEIVKAFEILGDESNYPIAIHCSIGTDRTGMMAFVINGLLGASYEQLNYEYMFSNLGNIGRGRNTWDLFLYRANHINKCAGDTFAEKTYNYLLKIGVKAEHIDTVIKMMTQ